MADVPGVNLLSVDVLCDPVAADPSDAHAIATPWGSVERDIERLIIPASTCHARHERIRAGAKR